MTIRLGTLNHIYGIGYKISPIGCDMRAGALRTLLLEKYVEKMLLHTNSIINLFQEIDHDKQEYELFDISLIASAARNIMETANMYCYFSERKITQDELEFRHRIAALNEYISNHHYIAHFPKSQDLYPGNVHL